MMSAGKKPTTKPQKKPPAEEVSPKSEIPWFEKYRPKLPSEMVGLENKIHDIEKHIKAIMVIIAAKEKALVELKKKEKDLAELKKKEKVLAELKSKETDERKNVKEDIETLEKIISDARKNIKDPYAVLLEGPPGVGKTTAVYAIARQLNMNIIETNASDVRGAEAIRTQVAETSRSKDIFDFAKKRTLGKLLLFDEVDGVSGQADRGGLAELLKIIKDTRFPIIMTANEYDRRLQSLYQMSERIPFNRIKSESVMKILKRIAVAEKITSDENTLQAIADNSNGDLRSAINDLQGVAQGKGRITLRDITEQNMMRDTVESIFAALNDLFKQKTLQGAKDSLDGIDIDYSLLHQWVNENLIAFLKHPLDLTDAYANLAIADQYLDKIGMYQDYGLLAYFYDVISGGIALSARRDRPPDFVKPTFPAMISSRVSKTDQPAILKIQGLLHAPQSVIVRNNLVVLRALAKDPDLRKRIIEWLKLETGEEKILK